MGRLNGFHHVWRIVIVGTILASPNVAVILEQNRRVFYRSAIRKVHVAIVDDCHYVPLRFSSVFSTNSKTLCSVSAAMTFARSKSSLSIRWYLSDIAIECVSALHLVVWGTVKVLCRYFEGTAK